MKTILVSGASGIVGYGILRSLKKSRKQLQLIGTTIYEDSVAQGFCDIFEQALPTSDAGYMDWLFSMIEKHHVNFMIPGIEADMYAWLDHLPELESSGVRVLLNDPTLIALCRDKWHFYEKLCTLQTSYKIDTSLSTDYEQLVSRFSLPFLLKPRRGYGSKGIIIIKDHEDFIKHQQEIGTVLMVQPIVGSENEEYTTAIFGDGEGSFYASISLKRKLSTEGYTEKAQVVELEEIQESISVLCEYFKPIGPTNFQFRRHGDSLKLLEINPRISSSSSIRTAFGYNECEMAIDYYLEKKTPKQPMIQKGTAVRYVEDFIFL